MGVSGFPEIELSHVQIFCLMRTCQTQEWTEVTVTESHFHELLLQASFDILIPFKPN